ncbi:MAG: SUMF1/EgtB/PvdO family nonheme iron enzyme [Nitrospinae bacterium]|nr:SUMF1/EgtB/PvdO family nonheme iron enzyme [Nitrospinota bacterium]
MIFLPEQCFTMGSEDYAAEAPEHKVCLSPFCLDKFEVNQRLFQEVMGYNPSESRDDSKPVENVTWIEADAYCRKLGKRLPSEAEWELAARGGSRSGYPWGTEMDGSYGWYAKNSSGTTHPAGRKKPNALGFHDMNGNVWEWVADWYRAEYFETLAQPSTPETNPQGPPTGQFILIRGGSFEDDPFFLRSSARYWYEPTIKNRALGFRCAANKPQPGEPER